MKYGVLIVGILDEESKKKYDENKIVFPICLAEDENIDEIKRKMKEYIDKIDLLEWGDKWSLAPKEV